MSRGVETPTQSPGAPDSSACQRLLDIVLGEQTPERREVRLFELTPSTVASESCLDGGRLFELTPSTGFLAELDDASLVMPEPAPLHSLHF